MLDKLKSRLSEKSGLQKQLRQNSPFFIVFFLFLIVTIGAIIFYFSRPGSQLELSQKSKTNKFPVVTVVPTPTPTPTPRPLTFAEMNTLYGPCVHLPVFLYHHIQSRDSAVANHQTSLTVYTDIFKEQMQYLKDKGYNVVSMNDLINFFDNGTPIPAKSILLTFDDGYGDFYTDAYPVLSNLGFKATVFTITGLVNNPDYLTWDEILSMNGPVLFGNHTWSHKSLPSGTSEVQRSEITTADNQLSERSLNSAKVFAYPNGGYTPFAETTLKSLNYNLAFGTAPGTTECKKQQFDLPRIRIGDASLSYYGF